MKMIEYWLEKLDALLDRECVLEVLIAEARRDALRAQYRGRGDVEALSRQERMAKLDALFEENASEEEPCECVP